MATATVVEIREQTDVTPQGQTRQVLVPVFQLPMFSGTFTAEGIPRNEFSRDRARAEVAALATQLVTEETEITVSFPSDDS